MGIQTCPECGRGMKDDEQTCPACGASLAINKARKIWIFQIKVYLGIIILGVFLLAFCIPKMIHHSLHTPPDQWLIIMAIGGGLGVMGGGFGVCVALFFYYLWKNKTVNNNKV